MKRNLRDNKKGGAVFASILVMLMLVIAGTAVLVFTGKKNIEKTDAEPVVKEELTDEQKEIKALQEQSKLVKSAEYKDTDDDEIDISSEYALLINADTKEIIAGHDYDQKLYPASLTKLMTLVIAEENIKDTSVTYTFTTEDLAPLLEVNASRAGFLDGDTVTAEDLMYATILTSGADGVVGITNMVSDSEQAFVELMNKKAQDLGMKNTHFSNATGLHDEENYSTCEDIAILYNYAMNNSSCKEILSAESYVTSSTDEYPEGIELSSIVFGRLQGYFVDMNGDGRGDADITSGKSGFTDEAGYCLATSLNYNGRNYICVVAKSNGELKVVEDSIAVYENVLGKSDESSNTEE